jgi:CRISPR-associated protein Cmr4
MFQAQQLVFYTCVSPLHMGAGSAVGAIDNPIQREVHTGYPQIAGSGLKGAIRHHFSRAWGEPGRGLIARLFGPETNASEFAGAIAFTDAQLVAFPVRSLRNTFVYATSPTALARLKRLATDAADWAVPAVQPGHAKLSSEGAVSQGRLVLEAFDFEADMADANVKQIAQWLAAHALPQGVEHAYFRGKLETDLAVLSDTEFSHFVEHATVVEAHVRINNESGTADPGGLFYTENLPPETLLAGLLLASVERQKKGDSRGDLMSAEQVLDAVLKDADERLGLADRLLQVGGDATTGRGLIVVHPAAASSPKAER